MQELLAYAIAIVIMISVLGWMPQPILGRKTDLFWLIRPMTKWALRLPGRWCKQLSALFRKWSKQLWRRRPRRWYWYFLFIPFVTLLVATGIILQIPAEILPRAKQDKQNK